MDIKHVVVLMLENRSFDGMLGMLHPNSDRFDGLTGTEQNTWHRTDGSSEQIAVWTSPAMTPDAACIPTPDPGELFADIHMQIHGMVNSVTLNTSPTMNGFVDNYMRQPPTTPAPSVAPDPAAVMHYFTDTQIPVLTQLARQFGVSDRWHASAPCQTWPNRFFAHTGTAAGYVNNSPTHFPYMMETVFNRLQDQAKVPWRIYFHDIPQTTTLSRLWPAALTHFRYFQQDFARDAASGNLPAYSFIEPRYFTDTVFHNMPNDQHPPHNIVHGEALIASVYNAVRNGPGWKNTLLIITYDEHGGCYDHVAPPAAVAPDNLRPDGFDFTSFGVRVPAVIVSPWLPAGSIVRPPGHTPFDHTTIISTLRKLFPFTPLTARDAAAPDLMHSLTGNGNNDGPSSINITDPAPAPDKLANAAAQPPNNMQHALNATALLLPTAGANIGAHIARLHGTPDPVPAPNSTKSASEAVAAHMKAFLGQP